MAGGVDVEEKRPLSPSQSKFASQSQQLNRRKVGSSNNNKNDKYNAKYSDSDSKGLPAFGEPEKEGKRSNFLGHVLSKCISVFNARFSATHNCHGHHGHSHGHGHLLKLEDVPPHLQFNSYVHAGYRDMQDFWGCVRSLFYFHNETVNIFTHVVPIAWVLMYWRTMYPWEGVGERTGLYLLGWCHILASISPWIGSVCYHLFMNHKKGEKLYNLLLQFDMFGIWVTECFGALPNLIAATWCLAWWVQALLLISYGLSSAWGLRKALTAWTPMGRRMCFAPVFVARILGFALRLSPFGGGETAVIADVILQDAISIVGGMVGVIRIPEKWFPGKVDLIFNSHHIMHVLVVLAVLHMNQATNGDVSWILKNHDRQVCY